MVRQGRVALVGVVAALLVVLVAQGRFEGVDAAVSFVPSSPRTDVLQVVDGEVLDSAVIGSRVVVVGDFTQVREPGGPTIDQRYIAAYDIDSGAFDSGFRPTLDDWVGVIEPSEDGTALYIGGRFRTVDGQTHRKIAKLTAQGDPDAAFTARANATVDAMVAANGKLYIGGAFQRINNVDRGRLAAVDAETGSLDATFDFPLSDSVGSGGTLSVRSMDATPDGSKLFVSHSARFVGVHQRTGIARFDISAGSSAVSAWKTDLYEDELVRLGGVIRPKRLAVSPDGSYVVIVNSGGDKPPTNDTAVRFPTSGGAGVEPDWVSRHFDTVLGVTISDDAVFVGGHFQYQEAPGSTDPFPGDPDVVYGFGQNQGPSILGDEVVPRKQIGALDPSSGKSLDWNPGSNTFVGVQSLTWVPGRGLLVGHDRDTLGGASVGRHGFFDLDDGGPPDPEDTFVCVRSVVGSDAILEFSGLRGSSEQLRRNGSWSANVTGQLVWQVPSGAGDTFSVRVRGQGFADPFEEFPCGDGQPPDPVALDTFIDVPLPGQLVPRDAILTITGRATAPAGVAKVRVSVIRKTTGEYLRADGTAQAGWVAIDVLPNAPGTDTTWSLDIPLTSPGDHKIIAKTFGLDGEKDPSRAETTFAVGTAGDLPPELVVTSPAGSLDDSLVEFAGSATDDLGIDSVSFTLRERDLNLYLRPDGTLGDSHRFVAELASPGASATDWSIRLVVPVGSWQAQIDAIDTSGQRDRLPRNFTQAGDATRPTIDLVEGADQRLTPGSQFTFTGTATAAAGIDSVEILIRNPLDLPGLQLNGSFGGTARSFPIPGVGGVQVTDWEYTSPALPAGFYDVKIKVIDDLGTVASVSTTAFAGTADGSEPDTTIDADTRFQQGFDDLNLSITGQATDDAGLSGVAITLYDSERRLWVQPDGTTASAPVPFVVPVEVPGATSSSWDFDLVLPEPSYYFIYARSIDEVGMVDPSAVFGSARAFPGDALPHPGFNVPDPGAVVAASRLSLNGRATDDQAIDEVEVRVRQLATGLYLRSNGSFGAVEWLPAVLTNPGGAASNWDFVTPDISAGDYELTARANDNHGQRLAQKRVVTLVN